jgi:hypothetical protein
LKLNSAQEKYVGGLHSLNKSHEWNLKYVTIDLHYTDLNPNQIQYHKTKNIQCPFFAKQSKSIIMIIGKPK